ncbi:ABC transporter permease [Paenibacillus thailandensis]|uniref:Transport permease protein n=1 Tax=Paenibacillus thailandensis TaxID=393250 RepID=A0ABW5QT89_9BACL
MTNYFKNKYFENFFKYRYLLIQLVKREFKVKYKRSILGVVWSLLNPLFTMIILTLVFSTLFKSNIPNFPVYFLCGSILFNFFSEATNIALGSIYINASLIKKVYIPKYMFPLSKSIFSFVNLLISLIAIVLVIIGTRTEFHWTMLLFFIPLIYYFIFTVGVCLILSCAAVFFRDLAHLYGIVLTAISFLTPLFYPVEILPDTVRVLVELSPITQTIQMFREIILYHHIPGVYEQLNMALYAIISLLVGVFVFYKKQDKFILYI